MKTGQKWTASLFTLALVTLSAPALAQSSGYGGGYSGLIAPTKQQQQNPQMQQRDVYPGVAVLGNSNDRPKGGLYGNSGNRNTSGAYNRYAGEDEMERKRREAYERVQEQQEQRKKLQEEIREKRLQEQRARMKEQAEAYARAQAEAQRKIAEEQRKRDQATSQQ